eukprot:gene25615-11268_t
MVQQKAVSMLAYHQSHDSSVNPLSPTNKEVLRGQMLSHQYPKSGASDGLLLYKSKTMEFDSKHGPRKLDASRHYVKSKVQDMLVPCGAAQRQPTNIPDYSPKNNVNILRFQREQHFADNLLKDGGAEYSPTACVGNWVEERRDKTYKSGFHARELGRSNIYMSEHMDRYRPTAQYKDKIWSQNKTASIPDEKTDKKNGNDSDSSCLYYSRGFGDTPHLDHTAKHRRGAFWVGTAPVLQGESVATTASVQEPLEFQNRVCFLDPKSKVITGTYGKDVEAQMTETVKDRIKQSERFSPSWKTMYNSQIGERASTASAYKSRGMSAEWAEAKAAAMGKARPNSSRK